MTRFFLSLILVIPCIIAGYVVVPVMLLTSWDGRTTWFGNAKNGKGPDAGYWNQFLYLAWRNPVNNLLSKTLAVSYRPPLWYGDLGIGDKTYGGFYHIWMGDAWEIYWVKPYGKRCIRFRAGWKINGKQPGELCELVLTFNPLKEYLGAK